MQRNESVRTILKSVYLLQTTFRRNFILIISQSSHHMQRNESVRMNSYHFKICLLVTDTILCPGCVCSLVRWSGVVSGLCLGGVLVLFVHPFRVFLCLCLWCLSLGSCHMLEMIMEANATTMLLVWCMLWRSIALLCSFPLFNSNSHDARLWGLSEGVMHNCAPILFSTRILGRAKRFFRFYHPPYIDWCMFHRSNA